MSLLIFGQSKINGLSFVASNIPISDVAIRPVLNMHANWLSLMPFGFMKTESDTAIVYNSKRQWWGETKTGITKTIIAFHKYNCKIMLKPQIWIANEGFTGIIDMKSERDWIKFENNYEKFILDYTHIAADNNVALFCIGTELHNFIEKRTIFWKTLLIKIKLIYNGKITYAENWDSYEKIPFISSLDYIGIDAYFPLSKEKSPTTETLFEAWQPIKNQIKKISIQYNKPILFTEFGYQSKDFSTYQPWNHFNRQPINLIVQCNGLKALFAQFWNEKWFVGGFLWKWYDQHNLSGGTSNTDYTIQNKPAEELVKNQFQN